MTGPPTRLPARVYWTRRLMVLGTAVLLVIAISRLLGSGSDAGSDSDQAGLAAAGTSSQTPARGQGRTHAPTNGPTSAPTTAGTGGSHHAHTSAPPMAMPSGPCSAADVSVSPSVPRPVAGRDIDLVLEMATIDTPACYWKLSSRSLAMKITSGSDLIWTSSQCPAVIPAEDLVLRNDSPTKIKIVWDARRSEPGCPALTDWALLGGYHLHVAALAGKPQDVYFGLVAPSPPEVTETVQPHGHHHKPHKHRAE